MSLSWFKGQKLNNKEKNLLSKFRPHCASVTRANHNVNKIRAVNITRRTLNGSRFEETSGHLPEGNSTALLCCSLAKGQSQQEGGAEIKGRMRAEIGTRRDKLKGKRKQSNLNYTVLRPVARNII
jgi:hypothetical protein